MICNLFLSLLLTSDLILETGKNTWINEHLTRTYHQGAHHTSYGTLLKKPEYFNRIISTLAAKYQDYKLDAIVAVEPSGFIFGSALAYRLHLPLVLVREPGKTPSLVETVDYYDNSGLSSLEIDRYSLPPGMIVLVVDDVLDRGARARAACELVEKMACMAVEFTCLYEIKSLYGRDRLERPVFSLTTIP